MPGGGELADLLLTREGLWKRIPGSQCFKLSGMWPVIAWQRLAHYTRLCGVYKWDAVHLSRDPEQSWKALIHALRGLPLVSCLPWVLSLRLSHPPAHHWPRSLGMLHASLMRYGLCSLRLQCKVSDTVSFKGDRPSAYPVSTVPCPVSRGHKISCWIQRSCLEQKCNRSGWGPLPPRGCGQLAGCSSA